MPLSTPILGVEVLWSASRLISKEKDILDGAHSSTVTYRTREHCIARYTFFTQRFTQTLMFIICNSFTLNNSFCSFTLSHPVIAHMPSATAWSCCLHRGAWSRTESAHLHRGSIAALLTVTVPRNNINWSRSLRSLHLVRTRSACHRTCGPPPLPNFSLFAFDNLHNLSIAARLFTRHRPVSHKAS